MPLTIETLNDMLEKLYTLKVNIQKLKSITFYMDYDRKNEKIANTMVILKEQLRYLIKNHKFKYRYIINVLIKEYNEVRELHDSIQKKIFESKKFKNSRKINVILEKDGNGENIITYSRGGLKKMVMNNKLFEILDIDSDIKEKEKESKTQQVGRFTVITEESDSDNEDEEESDSDYDDSDVGSEEEE